GRIDAGSRLLAAHLPRDLGGQVADFAAGWGYLSAEIAEQCPSVTALHLYEADHASLEAARLNMPQRDGLALEYYWHDLASEPVVSRYDAIISNPPFHAGRKAEPDLGQAILARAASALRPRGRLLIVANRQLPYEEVLARHFTRQRQLLVQDGYKILEAWK